MNTDFLKKVEEYQQAIKDVDEQKAELIINELRLYIYNRTRCDDLYEVDNQKITISKASIIELCVVYEDLKRKESISTLSVISDFERDKQMRKNKYGPNNPYNN